MRPPHQPPVQYQTYHPEQHGYPLNVVAVPQYPQTPTPPVPNPGPWNWLDSPVHFWLNLGVGITLGAVAGFMLWDGIFGGDKIREAQAQAAQAQAQAAQATQELNRIRGCLTP